MLDIHTHTKHTHTHRPRVLTYTERDTHSDIHVSNTLATRALTEREIHTHIQTHTHIQGTRAEPWQGFNWNQVRMYVCIY
jgi:hypothetical protein